MNDKLNAGVDPYLYPGIHVLKNKLEIHEANRLAQAEMAFTALRAATITLGQPAMGLPHLCAIHQTLFQDIYTWAGELREMDIYKEDTPLTGCPLYRYPFRAVHRPRCRYPETASDE